MRVPKSRYKQRELLNQYLAEYQERGLEIPEELQLALSGSKKHIKFRTTPDGYFYKQDGSPYIPNLKQEAFILSEARYVAFFSGRGAGKTSASSQKALRKIQQGESGFVMNPDFENLKISSWPEFREWIPWETVVPKHRRMKNPEWKPPGPFDIVFMNGAIVTLKGVQEPDSARGPNRNWLWYDEGTRGKDYTGEAWKIATASIRVGKDPQSWLSATPLGRDHWTYDFFVKQNVPEEVLQIYDGLGRDLIEVFHTSIEDNKDNLDPGFYAAILASYVTEWQRRREVLGEFSDEGGVMGDLAWFKGKILKAIPETWSIKKKVRFWDLAASEKKITGKKQLDPDETVGSLMDHVFIENVGNFLIEDQVAGRWIWDDIKTVIIQTAKMDGPGVEVIVEQEPASGGINQVAELAKLLKKELPGWPTLLGWRPEGDKVIRANPWYAEARNGLVWLLEGKWNDGFLDQFASFPIAPKDDKIDSVSGARHNVAPIRTWRSIDFLALTGQTQEEAPPQILTL